MTTKTVTTNEHGYEVVQTSNGVATRTRLVTRHPHRTYTPLPNGFNAELAQAVLAAIQDNELLWDQGAWRDLALLRNPEVQPLLQTQPAASRYVDESGTVVPGLPELTTSCGTVMCAAGWAVELTEGDWVIDAEMVEDWARHQVDRNRAWRWAEYYSAMALAPKTLWADAHAMATIESMPLELRLQLAARGFSDATHVVVSAHFQALTVLGLADTAVPDVLELFSEDNDLPMLRRIVDIYTEHGPWPSREVRDEFACLREQIRQDLWDQERAHLEAQDA